MKIHSYNENIELLTLATAGSVDDGKSTLIGRLLYDTDQLYDDQIEAIQKADRVEGELDFSLFTDGLSSEREQKITIDVAYRYFSTGKRRFIIADVPGHEQYTRNMVTGASKAQVGLILIDARKGLLEQSKRHLFIANLLGIPHIAIVINKMDLMDYSQEVFNKIKDDCAQFCTKLGIKDLQFIPCSSLKGDMVVERGVNMNWYGGRTVLNFLENIEISGDRNLIDFRFPVQYVVRPNQDFRGYAGKVEGGTVSIGEPVKIYPSGKTTKIKKLIVAGEEVDTVFSPQSAMLVLEDELDISRSDMIVREKNIPEVGFGLEAILCWFSENNLEVGKRYLLKHTTQTVPCKIDNIKYKLNISNLHREEGVLDLGLNEVGRVGISLQKPLFFDTYIKNKNTGSFIIIDELTNATVGAGVIRGKNVDIKNNDFLESTKSKGCVLWFTGLSGSGKSTIVEGVYKQIQEQGLDCEHLDGDILRDNITSDLDFSKKGREKNIEIAGFVAKMLADHGVVVLASFISPYIKQRQKLREKIDNFVEVFVDCPLEICEKRDVKGLYKKVRSGEIENFTGVSHPYESPENPELNIKTGNEKVEDCVKQIIDFLKNKNYL